MKNTWWTALLAIMVTVTVILSGCAGGMQSPASADPSSADPVPESVVSEEVSAEESGENPTSDSPTAFVWASHAYTAGIPEFVGGSFYAESGDSMKDALLLIYRDTAPEAFDTYRQTLVDAGFEQDYHTSEPSNEQYIYTNQTTNVYLLYQPELMQLQLKVYPVA